MATCRASRAVLTLRAGPLQRAYEHTPRTRMVRALSLSGEFNSGKSSVINALVGERLLAEGVTPTTADVSVLRHGSGDTAVPSAVSFLQPHQQQSQV